MDPMPIKSTKHTDRVFSLLTEQDEITWQNILYDLVKKEGVDPFDVDISFIAHKYIALVRELKEHDFRLSGKVLLAAAILLKLKSSKLVDEDISELDRILKGEDEAASSDDLLFEEEVVPREDLSGVSLFPRTPQPRKRKVSIYDLMKALEKALEVKHRRVINHMPHVPIQNVRKSRDITEVIREVYGRIRDHFGTGSAPKITFSQLLPSQSREDKVMTFIPLLHLSQQRKIDLEQEKPFSEIGIMLATKQDLSRELSEEEKTEA